jgi:outer membrane receptor protein involved in Fe transport
MPLARTVGLAILVLVLGTPVRGLAQSSTGTLDGVIRDSNDLPVPDVQVVVRSRALIQQDQTVLSDRNGYYRLTFLPPGDYDLAFTLQSFQPVLRGALVVESGRTTTVNVALVPAAVEQTVNVVGASSALDQRGAKIAFNYNEELAENIPTSRSFHGLVATIPGVESAGNYGVFSPGNMEVQNVLGAGARANSYTLDGANTTDAAGGWNVASYFSYDIIKEIQVTKAAKPAEVGFQGGLFTVVTKSGGNDFSGQIAGYLQSDHLQGDNAGEEVVGSGGQTTNEIKNDYDVSVTMGGPFASDKAWWFGSVRRQDGTSTLFGFPEDVTNTINAAFFKATYQSTMNHRFMGLANHWDQTVNHFFFNFSPALAGDADASVYRPIHGNTYGVHWNGILGTNVLAEAGWSTTEQGLDQQFQPGAGISVTDVATGQRFRNSGEGSRDQDFDNWSYKLALSWFVRNAWGRHDLKVGLEYLPTRTFILFDDLGDHRLNVARGTPVSVRILNTPSHATWNNNHLSFYAQDGWTIRNRLTVNVGLRFDRTHASTPEQVTGGGDFAGTALAVRFPQLERTVLPPTELLTWNNLAPRLAAIYSLDPGGRTLLRGSASRYYHNLPSFELFISNPAFPLNFITRWNDSNHDGAFQVGEDGVLFAQFGGQLNPIDPDIRRPYTDEFIAGASHELAKNVQLSANVIYRKDRDLTNLVDVGVGFDAYTPVAIIDPGRDGIVGTRDDAVLTVFAQDPSTIGDSRNVLTNPAGNNRTYKGVEVTAVKRLSDNWQAVASLVVSDFQVIKATTAGSSNDLFENPNALINARGKDPHNQTVQLKVQGTYVAPYGILVSGFYRFLTGLPYTRELLVEGLPQGTFNVFAEPRGYSKVDDQSVLDLRVEKRFRFAGRYALGLILDVFNVTNAAPVLAEGSLTGADYGQPQAVWNPRLARLGVRFTW